MPTLELLIDASGMQRGATEAENALRRVKAAIDGVTDSFSRARAIGGGASGGGRLLGFSGGGGAETFGVAGPLGGGGAGFGSGFGAGGVNASQVLTGGLQSAAGIASTANALGQLNIQAAAFAAARSAFEIGNTIQDFARFRAGVGGATTAMGALNLAFKANPIGAIAVGIGLAATAMSLFGSNTKNATDRVNEQGQALERLRDGLPELVQRVALGQDDPRRTDRGLIDAIIALRSGKASALRAGEAADIFGVSESFLRGGLQDFDINQRALERDAPGVVRDEAGNIVANPGRLIQAYANQGPGGFTQRTFTVDELVRFGTQLLDERRGIRNINDFAGLGPVGFSLFENAAINRDGSNRDFVTQGDFDRQVVEEERRINAAAKVAESLERAARFAEDIGASVGDAAAQILFAGQSLRGAVSGILRQFATQGLQSVGAGVFGALTRVVGSTATQQQGNQPVPGETPRPGG